MDKLDFGKKDLKLRDDFFDDKRIKKLRRLAGGDTYTIIYLKMQLLSVKNGGVLHSDNEDSFVEELAFQIGESVNNVRAALCCFEKCKLLETFGAL